MNHFRESEIDSWFNKRLLVIRRQIWKSLTDLSIFERRLDLRWHMGELE